MDVLRAKYEDSGPVHFMGRDFLELDGATTDRRFDGIILNPPFSRGEDIQHVLHAYQFLSSKGILAGIVSEGTFHRKDKKASDFRDFLATCNAQVESLPPGAFKASGTAAACRMIRVEATS